MHATSGDAKQNLTAAFWLSFKLSSKKVMLEMGPLGDGTFIPIRICIKLVKSPAGFPSFCHIVSPLT